MHKKTVAISLIACVIFTVVFVLFEDTREAKNADYIEKTNKEVVSIMDRHVPEIKELFYRNKAAFVEETDKDTQSDALDVDGERISIRLGDSATDSTIIKNVVIFTINSTMGAKGACFYEISIVYFPGGPPEQIGDYINFVKLDNDWYIKKDYFGGYDS